MTMKKLHRGISGNSAPPTALVAQISALTQARIVCVDAGRTHTTRSEDEPSLPEDAGAVCYVAFIGKEPAICAPPRPVYLPSMRLKSELFVSALLRRVFNLGGYAAVLRKGAEDAGAIFIRQRSRLGQKRSMPPRPRVSLMVPHLAGCSRSGLRRPMARLSIRQLPARSASIPIAGWWKSRSMVAAICSMSPPKRKADAGFQRPRPKARFGWMSALSRAVFSLATGARRGSALRSGPR